MSLELCEHVQHEQCVVVEAYEWEESKHHGSAMHLSP